jgi:hypothetical protein
MGRSTKKWNDRISRRKSRNNDDEYLTREYKKSMVRYTGNILDGFRSEFIETMERNTDFSDVERVVIEEILDEAIKNSKIIFTKNIFKQKKIK